MNPPIRWTGTKNGADPIEITITPGDDGLYKVEATLPGGKTRIPLHDGLDFQSAKDAALDRQAYHVQRGWSFDWGSPVFEDDDDANM
jgi:hypothetical protein